MAHSFPKPLLEVRLVKDRRTRFYTVRAGNREATQWTAEYSDFLQTLEDTASVIDRFRSEINTARRNGWTASHRYGLDERSGIWRPLERDLDDEP